jgi:hypothetical protein
MPKPGRGEVVFGDQRVVATDELPVGMTVKPKSGRRWRGPVRREPHGIDRPGDRSELLEKCLQAIWIVRRTYGNELLSIDAEIDSMLCLPEGSDRIKDRSRQGGSRIP